MPRAGCRDAPRSRDGAASRALPAPSAAALNGPGADPGFPRRGDAEADLIGAGPGLTAG
jgi:hypothetical protein